jgi:photosystem II stability/assembly factor-like uncharacterized protein
MRNNSGMASEATLLVGTRKGLFMIESSNNRATWSDPEMSHEGWYVLDAMRDVRTGRIWACCHNDFFGPKLSYSDDGGKTWQDGGGPKNEAAPVEKYWKVEPGIEDGVLFCGCAPGQFYRSDDNGETWQLNQALAHHPTRDKWNPGAGGMMFHSIVPHPTDPKKMWLGASAIGVFYTDDGGQTWTPENKNVRADFFPDPYPEVGQCVHKLVMDANDDMKLYQQNHCGMYRSDDGGESWVDIGDGKLPTRFGFPMAAHPSKSGMIWIAPQQSDGQRFMIDGKMCVYKSSDGGETWQDKRAGLPQSGAFVSVLREGLGVDRCDPCGVYVGTTGGALFGSKDEGETWNAIASFLPPISSVTAF